MAYHFGAFRYDPDQRLLFRGEERVPLLPKVTDTLHVLLERHGEVIEKAELMRLIWPDATVEEIGLNRNISLLRKALEDNIEDSPVIETIPRRGYRFAAPLSPKVNPEATPAKRKWPLALVATLAISLFAAFIYYQFYVPSRLLPSAKVSVAVIPFACQCPGLEGYPESLNEVLVNRLAQTPGVHVTAPSTVRRHQRVGVSTGLMGRLLGLDALLEGSILKQGADLVFNTRLVDVHTGKVIWANTSNYPAANPNAAINAIASSTAQSIQPLLAKSATP